MRAVRATREIEAPASAAWDLLTLVEHWPEWGPSVRAVECDDARIRMGSTGRVVTTPGPSLPFEVTDLVDDESWAWKVAGVPATGHRVEPLGPERCRIAFSVPLVAAPYLAVCRLALARLDRALTASKPE